MNFNLISLAISLTGACRRLFKNFKIASRRRLAKARYCFSSSSIRAFIIDYTILFLWVIIRANKDPKGFGRATLGLDLVNVDGVAGVGEEFFKIRDREADCGGVDVGVDVNSFAL